MKEATLFSFLLYWGQEHLLALTAVALTLLLLYLYLIERKTEVKLSRKYRNSVYEAQSKIFLNATRHLIEGNKNLAIREFLNAVDLNRETIDTYFALGGLFRSNGEIDKAIGIHRSLFAREGINEETRLKALKELALDFDRGGFVEKALETYKDVLKINRDQEEVIRALCRIYEDIEDWDEAYKYRLLLSKVGHENQSETIAHILTQKARNLLSRGNIVAALEEMELAYRYAPCISAKMLKIKMMLILSKIEDAKIQLLEFIHEHPDYSFILFDFLEDPFRCSEHIKKDFARGLEVLKETFLSLDDKSIQGAKGLLPKILLLRQENKMQQAYELIQGPLKSTIPLSESLMVEYIKILLELNHKDEALELTKKLLSQLNKSTTKHFCGLCGFSSDTIFWRCPKCKEWESIQFRLKI